MKCYKLLALKIPHLQQWPYLWTQVCCYKLLTINSNFTVTCFVVAIVARELGIVNLGGKEGIHSVEKVLFSCFCLKTKCRARSL